MEKKNSTFKWGLKFIPLLLAVFLLSFGSNAQKPIKIDGDPSDWPVALGGLYPFAFVHDANSTNDDSFHSGIDQDLISAWKWVNGNTNDKGDISNAGAVLIHDTIFFMGDRVSDNGDANIGFWLFLGGVAKGPVLATTPYDFVGIHEVGDLFVQCDFTGGGAAANVQVYEWVGSGGSAGTLNLLTTGIQAGATSNATNMAVPVFPTWSYTPKSGTGYAANTFYEGYIHLNTENNVLQSICFSTFLLETRNSQSLNASRQDFAGGTFAISPDVPVTVGDEICAPGGVVNLSASGEAGAVLKWYRNAGLTDGPIVGVTTDYSTTVTQTTTWWVTATNDLGCTSDAATVTATVLPAPVCSITGTLSVCPHGDFIYSGPPAMTSYLWSIIAGSATIPGAANGVNVTVHSNATCGSFTLQLVITGANGCTSTCTQIVSVVDTQKPVINATGTTLTLGCNPSAGDINAALGTATATDNCDGTLTPTSGDSSVTGTDCNKSQTRTWNVTDACGNSATPVTRTVTWKTDLVKPVIVANGTTLTLGCNPSSGDINAALGTATAMDNCDGTLTPTFGDSAVTGTDCSKSQTRTWNVTDNCGNTATPVTRTVTWKTDLVKPVIVANGTPSNGVLGCNPSSAVINAALGTATATDNCDGVLTPTFVDSAVTGTDCNKSQTRTWNVTDNCGNTATPVSRTVTWKTDLVKPVIVANGTPSNGVLGCNPSSAVINAALGTATATDNCDGVLTPTFVDSAVTGTDCNKSQTRTWNVTDLCGNTATPVSRTVTWKVDLVKPVIVATGTPSNGVLGCNPSSAVINAALGTATATDNCDGVLTPTFVDSAVTGTDCNKSQTRTWNVTDLCGNTATPVSRTVTWKTDLVKPVIVANGTTLTLGCNPSTAVINAALGTATATDNCDGTLTPTSGDSAVTGTACNKSQTRTWNVTDLCGNTATPVSRTVTWKVDLTPPALQVALTDLVFECYEAVIIPVPSFVDNCDGAVSFTCAVTGAPGANCNTYKYPIGDTQVCFTAVDGCGNTTSVCIKVTVKPCPQNCTYTQGFYGNQKGKACDLTSTPKPGTEFTAALLAEGPMVIGAGSNTITFMPGDAPLLQAILPGGGGSYVLSGTCDPPVWDPNNVDFGCLDPYLKDRQHRLDNTLLAQTITLGLNMRIGSNTLGGLPLQSGKWLVTQDKKSCEQSSGLVDPVCSSCSTVSPTCNYLSVDPYHYYQLNAGVICYMSKKGYAMTIQGLFNLANDALGGVRTFPADVNCGTGTSTVTLSDIAGAVDLINNIFDECKSFVGYWDNKYTCTNSCTGICPKSASIPGDQQTSLGVYPNPFNQSVTFEFVPGKDAHASLDIYNMLGQKVRTLLSKQVEQGTTYKVEFQPDNMVPGVLIYKLVLDNDVQTGKVIYNK